MTPKEIIPKEEDDMLTLAECLDRLGLLWFHPANEGKRKPQYAAKMARLGLKPGVPDVIIFNRPPEFSLAKGAVIELKRKKGGQVSDEQDDWLIKLSNNGWCVAVCCGIDKALEQLRIWGYLRD